MAKHGLSLHQVDVTTAFLNGTLEDEVYMEQPKGFECQGKEEFVCKLNKSIYGLKQSPHCWNSTLDAYLKKMQFTQTASDPCIYYRKTEKDMMFIGVYVDDLILAARNEKQLKQVKENLSNKFDIKDLGELKYFLDIKVEQNKESDPYGSDNLHILRIFSRDWECKTPSQQVLQWKSALNFNCNQSS